MNATVKKVLIGSGIAAGLLFLYKMVNAKPTSQPTTRISAEEIQQALRAKSWIVAGWTSPRSGSTLNIRLNDDGSVIIGDGYKGSLLNENTIVTNSRNGVPETATKWTAV